MNKPAVPQAIEFYPHRLTPWFVRLTHLLLPTACYWLYKINGLGIAPECQDNLKLLQNKLRNKRLILLSNHPTFNDPIILFLLSGCLRQSFYYLSDLPPFRSKLGPFLQRWGGYSIRRGRADAKSVRYTLKLLAQPNCRLVVFPEGGASFQNDTVMPFRPGAIKLALQSLVQLDSSQNDAGRFDLYGVPISLKYHYCQDMQPTIDNLLQTLEQELKISPTPIPTTPIPTPPIPTTPIPTTQWETYQRLRIIGETVLENCEQDYGFNSPKSEDLNKRIRNLKQQVLNALEQDFGIAATPGWADRERAYRIQHWVEDLKQKTDHNSNSWQDPMEQDMGQIWTYDRVMQTLRRIVNFDAIYEGYVEECPSQERYLDILIRLEREVFNIEAPSPKGRRKAFLYVGEPINLRQFLPAFEADRTSTVQEVTQQFQTQVQENLDALNQLLINS
jgi:1-acyl-sn-glycerol-3-phosphate acyltransferase